MNKSYRCFMVTLWEKSDSYDTDEVIQHIIDLGYEYAYILHDKDDAKPHYHIVIYLGREVKKTLNTIYKEIGIPNKQDIEIQLSLKTALQYLIHYNNDNKYHYSTEEVVGSLKDKLNQYINTIDEGLVVNKILNYLKDNPTTNLYQLAQECYLNGWWATYRRNYSIIKDILYQETR